MLTTKNWDAVSTFAVMALLGVVMLTGCTPPGARALLDGDRLIREQQYSRAIDRLKVAVELAPEHARAKAWNFLGLAYHGAGDAAQAAAAYQKAIQIDPNLAVAHYNLGCLWLEQNNLTGAVTALTTYTVLERTRAPGWAKLGAAQLRLGQIDAAERSYQNALSLSPSLPEALNGMGIVQLYRKRLRESVQFFNAAARQSPPYGPALLNLGIVSHHYLTNAPAALQAFHSYLALRPPPANAAAVRQYVARLQAELAPPPVAQASPPAQIIISNPPASQLQPPGNSNATAATPSPIPAPANQPDPEPPSSARPEPKPEQLADKPARSLDTASIRKATLPEKLSDAPANLPVPAEPTAASGGTNVNLAQAPASQPSPRESAPEPPQPASADQPTKRSLPPAESPTDQARDHDPRDIDPIGAGMIVNRSRDREQPGISQRLNPANWFRKEGPEPAPDKPAEPNPTAPPIETAPPVTRTVIAQPPIDAARFPRYRYRSPSRPAPGDRRQAEPLFSAGLKAHQARRLTAAVEAYRKAIALDPSYYEACYNLGLATYDLKDYAQSLAAYELALAIHPESFDAKYNFALALQQANYPVDAANELKELLATHPSEPRVHFTLAKLYSEQLNEIDAARQHYRRVLQLDPEHPYAVPIRHWLANHP